MKCEDLQFDLPLYAENCVTAEERAKVDAHLAACPLCREKSADFQNLKNDLRILPRPEMPAELLASLRTRIAEEVGAPQNKPHRIFSENFAEWLQMRFLPYAAATAVTLVFGLSLLWTLLSAANVQNKEIARAEPLAKSTVMLAGNSGGDYSSPDFFNPQLSAADLAAARIPITNEAPTINPKGALIALSKSLVRGNMKDDEVVVVADVFSSGLAQIAEVVEPSGDRRAVRELENALKNNPDFAPFLPASVDGRSDTVRVVLKFQRVDVPAHVKSKKR